METPNASWPTRRGFDRFFGTLEGAGSFYRPRTLMRDETNVEDEAEQPGWFYTDAISDNAVSFIEEHDRDRADDPFFLYLAYTAPHWPLHAHEEDVARYAGRFDAGWDTLREERLARLVKEGIVGDDQELAARDPRVPAWDDNPEKAWDARRMEVYAAQVDRMDQGIGRVLDTLERLGRLDNTLVVFLSDNGGCAEELDVDFVTAFVPLQETTREGEPVVPGNVPGLMPGSEATYMSYGRSWAHLSNTPFREYKHWVHEGGIATPLVARWPRGLSAERGSLHREPYQLVGRAADPARRRGCDVPDSARRPSACRRPRAAACCPPGTAPTAGTSRRPVLGARGQLRGPLGPLEAGPQARHAPGSSTPSSRTAPRRTTWPREHPDVVADLAARYEAWAQRCGVIPREVVLDLYARRGKGLPPE